MHMRNRNGLRSSMYAEGMSTAGAEALAPDPRVQDALRRLERAIAGHVVPEPMTDLDKAVDWYAGHFLAQAHNYLALAAADLQARVSEGVRVLPGVDEQRAQEAAEEARKQEAQRAEVAEALAAGHFRLWRGTPNDHPKSDRLVEVTTLADLVCPVCGRVSPELARLVQRWGETLLHQNRPRDRQPDPDRRRPYLLSSAHALRRECSCSCGVTFPIALDVTPHMAAYQEVEV